MDLMDCPECNHKILSRMGTVCPNCSFTVGFFNGDKRRKKYSNFFAITVATPFISLILLIVSSLNKYLLLLGVLLYLYLVYKSFPYKFKDVFIKRFDTLFFYGVWIVANTILLIAFINLLFKSFK